MKFLLFLITISTLISCKGSKEEQNLTTEKKAQKPISGVAYEIFVQSFYDTNKDSIGDIKGLIAKLYYLEELNVDAVWLMPIMPSPSYHKYDVTDYYDIHPDYGTMSDFKSFVSNAHEKNIKVIIDLVVNHTSSRHPWFVEAAKGPDNRYRDYYVWADKDSIAEQLAKKEISFDSDNLTQWHSVNGDTLNNHYYGFFWGGMPDLNFDNPEVRREIYDIGRYWLEDIGVDGFRLDAAKHIYPDDRAADNHEFWKEFKTEMEKADPDVYLVGEIWANAETTAPYAAGFTSFFNFDLAYSILESVKRGNVVDASIAGHGWEVDENSSFISTLIANRAIYKDINPSYQDAIFLTNHDQNRVMSVLENDINKAKVVASILLTLPGTPYIYYGEEIGMRGKKPDPKIREPFLWKSGEDPNRPKWIDPYYNTTDNLDPLTVQRKDTASLFNHYKEVINLRKAHPVLEKGKIRYTDVTNSSVVGYIRENSDEQLLILHNISDDMQTISLGGEIKGYNLVKYINGRPVLISEVVELAPYSSVILSKDL